MRYVAPDNGNPQPNRIQILAKPPHQGYLMNAGKQRAGVFPTAHGSARAGSHSTGINASLLATAPYIGGVLAQPLYGAPATYSHESVQGQPEGLAG